MLSARKSPNQKSALLLQQLEDPGISIDHLGSSGSSFHINTIPTPPVVPPQLRYDWTNPPTSHLRNEGPTGGLPRKAPPLGRGWRTRHATAEARARSLSAPRGRDGFQVDGAIFQAHFHPDIPGIDEERPGTATSELKRRNT